jgi:TolB-like protein
LKRRRVVRALVVWGLIAFAVLQVYEPVMHGLHLPEWTLSFVVVVLGLGFPIIAVLAWVFDLKASGIERTPPTVGSELGSVSGAGPQRLRLALLLLGLGAAAAAPGLVYFFAWPGLALRSTGGAGAAQVTPSIGVLPLVNLSSDKEQEYFSDGLTEELLNMLAKVPGLRVAARTSAFAFKGKNEDLRTVGQKLNVSHVLEGSVRKSGDQIRISTQLISASDGYHLWSETYDRKLTDVFAVQDEIATAVVSALKLKLLEAPSSKDRRTPNLEAYNQYLLGRQFLERNNLADQRRAAQAYRKAVELDPMYAPAWAGLATAMFFVADQADSPAAIASGQEEARDAAERAVALRPDLADGFQARGFIRGNVSWDWAGAEADLRRALELEPENSRVLATYADVVLHPKGRVEEMATTLRKAIALDPLNAGLWDSLGSALISGGQLGPAREALDRSLEINPTQASPAVHLAVILLLEKRPAEALAISQRSSEVVFRLLMAALAQHDLGHPQEAQRLLDEIIDKFAYSSAFQVAEAYAWRGERDRAFEWLQRALVQHDTGLAFLKADVLLRGLHGDARWTPLLRSVNLPVETP